MRNITRLALCMLLSAVGSPLLAQPVANFTATPVVGCAPLLVNFTNTSTGNPTSYLWNLGNSATSVLTNPSTTYTVPGTYTVTLTATNASGSNTKTQTSYITVHPDPIVSFTGSPLTSCPPLNAVFTNTSNPVTPGPATYNWSFGDGYVSSSQNPTHPYLYPGLYNVTLVVTNSGGCNSSLTKPNYIQVYAPPVADFSAPQAQCDYPANVPFTTTVTGSGPFVYSWNFGNGNTGVGATPSTTYNTPGSYTVTLVVTDINGCKDTVVKPGYITVGSLVPTFTVVPSSGCVNTPLQFTNTTTSVTSTFWDFGDGGTANVSSPTYVYTTPGTFLVKMKVTNSTCTDSIVQPVTIHPQPVANFSFAPPCPAPATVVFTNTTSGASLYSWTFGDGGTSTFSNPTHVYNTNDYFDVQLIATNSFGCKDTVKYIDTVRVYDLYAVPQGTTKAGCIPLQTKFWVTLMSHTAPSPPWPFPTLSIPYPYPIVSWFWDFGNGVTSTLDSPSHTFTVPGFYWVKYTVTTSNGCTLTDSIDVMGGTLPVADFSWSPDTVCIGDTVHFVNLSTGVDTNTQYYWHFGDVLGASFGISLSENPSYIYNIVSGGPFTVTLTVDNWGCKDSVKKDSIIVVYPPTSIPRREYDCDTPLLVRFYDTTSIDYTSHLWDFGDGTTTTATNPTHIFQTLGAHTVTLTTWNSVYGCTHTRPISVFLLDPVVTFSTPDTAICRGDSIAFVANYTAQPTMQYAWAINNQFLSGFLPLSWPLLDTFGYKFEQNSINTITVIQKDIHECLDTAIRPNYVLVAKPDAQFTANPDTGCVPLHVTFTDVSTNTPGAYSIFRDWIFGNGNTASVTTATTSSVYNAAGLYHVQMIVTDNVGCMDTLLKNNFIDARQPVANYVVGAAAACIGQSIPFTNLSLGTSLSSVWDFGDGTTSTAFSPTKTYSQTGVYTISLIVTDPTGCKDTMIGVNQITISKPNASFTMSDTLAICPPLNVLFTNPTTGATSYAWDFGNAAGSGLQNPSAIYTVPGIYTIRLIATDNVGCMDTAYGQAHILGYAGGLSYTPLSGCAPMQVQFTATLNNVPTIIWDFSDGVTQPANGASTTTHTYLTPGSYVPKLILSDGAGCLNSSQGFDTIKVDDVLAGYTTSPACEQTVVQFQDTSFSFFSPVTSWYWSFNNGQSTSAVSSPNNYYPIPGNYPVLLIATNANGCKDTITKDITINPLPNISAGPDTLICLGDAAQLLGTGGATYTWSPNINLSCTNCPNPLASPAVSRSYVVKGTDINGCQNADTVTVNLQYITSSVAGDGGEICDDSTFQLFASGAHKYEWKPAESLSDSKIANPIATPHTTTIYTVTAWEGSCPTDSHKIQVVVYPKPVVYAGGDEKIVAGAKVMLNATGTNITSFIWSPSASLSCVNCSNPEASPKKTTQYSVLALTNHGCKHSDTVNVFVICDNSQLFIPSYFSPNDDGNNDIFYPRGEGLTKVTTFRIYNRLGELVFERSNFELNDIMSAWDGTFKGRQLSPDVFVYLIQGVCESGEVLLWKGDVTLGR